MLSLGHDLERLLERARRGDERAWSDLVHRYQSLVYSVPRRMGLHADDCADVFQATFLALYRSLDRIAAAQTLPRWLGVTAGREAMRIKRVSGRYVSVSAEEGRGLDELLVSEEASAEEAALRESGSFEIRRAMSQMPARCRDLLQLLYDTEEPAYAEIGERLGMPIGAIGPTRARCLDKLRKELARAGFFGDDVSKRATTGSPI